VPGGLWSESRTIVCVKPYESKRSRTASGMMYMYGAVGSTNCQRSASNRLECITKRGDHAMPEIWQDLEHGDGSVILSTSLVWIWRTVRETDKERAATSELEARSPDVKSDRHSD
jgi:hypothetical protein